MMKFDECSCVLICEEAKPHCVIYQNMSQNRKKYILSLVTKKGQIRYCVITITLHFLPQPCKKREFLTKINFLALKIHCAQDKKSRCSFHHSWKFVNVRIAKCNWFFSEPNFISRLCREAGIKVFEKRGLPTHSYTREV